MNRGFSSTPRGCAGAAAAKHSAGSKAERTAKDAAKITEDLRTMVAVLGYIAKDIAGLPN